MKTNSRSMLMVLLIGFLSFASSLGAPSYIGDDIMDFRLESYTDDSAIFQVYQSVNPKHGCAQYQDGCDYDDYTWLGGRLLKEGKYLNSGHSSGTKPGEEFQPEELSPYIVGWNRVEIAVFGNGPITCDEVEFSLYEGSNKGRGTFFTKRFPFAHTWNPNPEEEW